MLKGNTMKRCITSFALIAASLFLTSCATLLGPREVEIPLAQLQEAIANRFPFNSRYLQLLDVKVSNPHVTLQPESSRILTSMDTSIMPPFMNTAWAGNFAVSGQLRFDPTRNALVLAEPRVENFMVHGLDPLYANQIGRIGSFLAEELLKDVPLYAFQPNDFRYGGTNFMPSKITTTSNALVVTFEPAK
jgi:hypothetical protein